jgi:hypothetical protein
MVGVYPREELAMATGTHEWRNPFGVSDAPDPDGADVAVFASTIGLGGPVSEPRARAGEPGGTAAGEPGGGAQDPNGAGWPGASEDVEAGRGSIEGEWSSRWNGGVDGTIAGDTKEAWKQGRAEVKLVGDRVYVLFDWADGKRRALVDARREGADRLMGRYVNLSDPTITQPWAGLIVNTGRIYGRWPNGRLDFHR